MSTFPRFTRSGYCAACGVPRGIDHRAICKPRSGQRLKFQASRRAAADAHNSAAMRAKDANDRRLAAVR